MQRNHIQLSSAKLIFKKLNLAQHTCIGDLGRCTLLLPGEKCVHTGRCNGQAAAPLALPLMENPEADTVPFGLAPA
eukprot:8094228-Pyramimonas_sp.AAC.1